MKSFITYVQINSKQKNYYVVFRKSELLLIIYIFIKQILFESCN